MVSPRVSIVPGGSEGRLVLRGRRPRDLASGRAGSREPRYALRGIKYGRRGRGGCEEARRVEVRLHPGRLLVWGRRTEEWR